MQAIEKISAKIVEAAENSGGLILSPFGGFFETFDPGSLDAALKAAGRDELLKIKRFNVSGARIWRLPDSVCLMENLEVLDASYTSLRSLPKSIHKLKNLKELDISRSEISGIPPSLAKCAGLAFSRRHAKAIAFSGNTARWLSGKLNVFVLFQKWIYSYMYRRLDAMQQELDLCGWRELAGACRRNSEPCCTSGGKCGYLGDKGCTEEALACKMWLCRKSLEYMRLLEADKNHPLHKKCLKYQRMRRKYDELSRALDIRFKGRASKEDCFNPEHHGYQNTTIDHWYDNIYIRPWGQFISEEDAGHEREVKPSFSIAT
ncbi:leucine Rich Repeat domain protein [Leadbettera azotonutricia ZAS-9]|uniref:Leucine Rich Repeat domain protein n=1 Tax=Leadbettera azotonutricia (strain ATCC BAA-888 / DSM 13862 / ZAS-9) TaxID=545695 RepID=F5YGH1_LEAAZ|nr:leucine Rich Repeat domain protein [Leadbettera azotonutricia ZAS-9]